MLFVVFDLTRRMARLAKKVQLTRSDCHKHLERMHLSHERGEDGGMLSVMECKHMNRCIFEETNM